MLENKRREQITFKKNKVSLIHLAHFIDGHLATEKKKENYILTISTGVAVELHKIYGIRLPEDKFAGFKIQWVNNDILLLFALDRITPDVPALEKKLRDANIVIEEISKTLAEMTELLNDLKSSK